MDRLITLKEVTDFEEISSIWYALSDTYNPSLIDAISDFDNYVKKISEYGITTTAYVDGNLAGASAYYANDFDAREGYITQFAVCRCYQNSGIARILMEKVLCDSKKRGMKRVLLRVLKNNVNAIGFYRHLGFNIEPSDIDEYFLMYIDI